MNVYILKREICGYADIDLYLGVFLTEIAAIDAKNDYIQNINKEGDPYEEKGYDDINLFEDIEIIEKTCEISFEKYKEVYLIGGTCDGYGQVDIKLHFIFNNYDKMLEKITELEKHKSGDFNLLYVFRKYMIDQLDSNIVYGKINRYHTESKFWKSVYDLK